MGQTGSMNSPDFWLKQAEAARARATQLSDTDAHRLMLEIVTRFDKLAHLAEHRIIAPVDPDAKVALKVGELNASDDG
jgi:hypothetical protein